MRGAPCQIVPRIMGVLEAEQESSAPIKLADILPPEPNVMMVEDHAPAQRRSQPNLGA